MLYVFTDHMTSLAHHKHHTPSAKGDTSPERSHDSLHGENRSKYVTRPFVSWPCSAQALSTERSCEDRILARDVNTKTQAKPGSNYLCFSSQGEHFDYPTLLPPLKGLWTRRHTRGRLLLKSDGVSRVLCLASQTKQVLSA